MKNKEQIVEDIKPTLTADEMKDVRLLVLEIQNVGLQIQSLQSRFNELNASARSFETALLKNKKLSTDDYMIDFNNIEIIAKPKAN